MTYTHDQLIAAAVLSARHNGRQTVLLSCIDGTWWAVPYTGLPAWQVAQGELYDGRFTEFEPAFMADVENITPTVPETPTDENTEKHRASQ